MASSPASLAFEPLLDPEPLDPELLDPEPLLEPVCAVPASPPEPLDELPVASELLSAVSPPSDVGAPELSSDEHAVIGNHREDGQSRAC